MSNKSNYSLTNYHIINSNKSNNNSNCNKTQEKFNWNRVINTHNAQCKMTGLW